MTSDPEPDWYSAHVRAHDSPVHPRRRGRSDLGPCGTWRQWWDTAVPDDRSAAVELARRQGWAATVGQLRELGWHEHDLRRMVRRGKWFVPRYGVASPVVPGGDERRAHALASTGAVLVRPDHAVSGRSAAIVHGLPTVRVPYSSEITRRSSTTGRRSSAHVYGATLTQPDIDAWFGAPVTTVARTLVDLGRHDAWDAIMAVDAALREQLITSGEIRAALGRAAGWPGVRQARDVLASGDPRSESALESLARWRLQRSGFPPPLPQFEVGGFFVDLGWPEFGFVLECDGRVKYRVTGAGDGPVEDPLWREKRREGVLRRHGYAVDRVMWSDVTRDWPAVCERLARNFPAEIARSIVPR